MTSLDPGRLHQAFLHARTLLLAERTQAGHWVGELSPSALSTATAVSALAVMQKQLPGSSNSFASLITQGCQWLVTHQNADGGWGDTVVSNSNISTSMLCRAAFELTGLGAAHSDSVSRLEAYLHKSAGATPAQRAEAVRARYGKDRTFAVPILTTCALAGLVDWREVPALPFEFACLPPSWYRLVNMQVVSYALPALIAIGQTIHHHKPSWNPLVRWLRSWAVPKSLRVLRAIQPSSGGYLEATPLTSFVCLSLASSGKVEHPVVQAGCNFLVRSVRPDGSWPIDSNLSIWVTTLSLNAFSSAGELTELADLSLVRDWLLDQQTQEPHPYTGAAPGAWGWSDLPGSVPDADDTPGVLLALAQLPRSERTLPAVEAGVGWLLDLQNRDGGWPTFCRGWGRLPFDRSGADLTAHALRALHAWGGLLPPALATRVQQATQAGLAYLARTQRRDGSWLPLWFGNQHLPGDENPTYGTARVLAVYRELDRMSEEPAQHACRWLLAAQRADGSWGGGNDCPGSCEETALAVEVLGSVGGSAQTAVNKGASWLVEKVLTGELLQPTPIGFYFAKLWYFEKLYPIIFSVAALGRTLQTLRPSQPAAKPADLSP